MKKLRITFKNQLYALQDLIMLTIVSIIILLCILYYDYNALNIILFTYSILFFIFYLPVIILHVNYLNNGEKNIDIRYKQIIVKNKLIEDLDIISIDLFATKHHYLDLNIGIGGVFFPYGVYYYYVYIKLKDGNVFFLNSLLGYKLDQYLIENFPNVKINKNISIYPYI